MPKPIELEKLAAFVAVVEERNITRAAIRLNMQQPPLTRMIKSLEQRLDTILFKRLPRGVEVTETGKALYEQAIAVLDQAQSIQQHVSQVRLGLEGQIKIGFTHSVGMHAFLPRILRQFRGDFAKVAIYLEEDGSKALSDALLMHNLDLIFLRKPAPLGLGLDSILVLQEPLIVAMPLDHPLAEGGAVIELKALAEQDFVLYRRLNGQDLYDHILANCYRAGFNPKIVQEAPRLTSSLNLVAAGIGLSIVPKAVENFWNTQLCYKSLSAQSTSTAPIYAVFRAGQHNIRLQHFLDHLDQMIHSDAEE
ncbi:DNA-binding transcriptional LysR family regulator [Acinetobacter calcoaceticus]|uniref:DNA-binding transcriptional LysR family regulator n=1 Tax=Acinetobacter calcoaceticus TaxID=471 RepID=A0A4V6NJA6_ACICA|nr:DNA-binding transcriptional LysR family regulator [Acinetobacter calcoaceticus]